MQLTREDFQKFLYTYNEDELFYRTLYFEKKEHPETFHKFCLNLDCDLISRRQLYVPELQKKAGILILKKKPCFVIQQITSCYTSITVIHQNSFMNMSFRNSMYL